ncbi:TAFII55 protein conserved region-domain-containing protein [Pelagophyceae sp. CCMP2097]|nr:TAFII55 protein conserved region-domain-containing protein [Pelagophyceae sp. CCMP2097]
MSFVPNRPGQTQLMLRLPSDALARRLREKLSDGSDGVELVPEPLADEASYSALSFESQRFTFVLDAQEYPARLANLPTIVETHKTMDRSTYYKTGDVSQVLLVFADEADRLKDEARAGVKQPLAAGAEAPPEAQQRKRMTHPDGLSPPLKDVVQRRFAKAAKRSYGTVFSPQEIAAAEKEMVEIYAASEKSGKKDAAALQASSKDREIVLEEVVQLEDWMIDPRTRDAVRDLSEDHPLVAKYPWILLDTKTARRPVINDKPAGTAPVQNGAAGAAHASGRSTPNSGDGVSATSRDSPAAISQEGTLAERRGRTADELWETCSTIDVLEQEANAPDPAVRSRAAAALLPLKDRKRKLTIELNKIDEKLLFEAANA